MASDESAPREVSVDLPADVREWLDDCATSDGDDADDVARRLLAAHHELATGDGLDAEGSSPADGVAEDDLDERLAALDAEFRDLVEDVRKRVVQVKRETDRKAPEDHDHPELADRVEDAERRAVDAAERVAELDDAVDRVEAQLDAGFENYEDILEYLTDETGSLRDRTDTLARAVIELRGEFQQLAAERARREGVEELKRAAAQYGVRTADCGACEASLDVAMLTAPECPHCASTLTDVRPGSRFLKPNVLVTGDPPALTGGDGADLDADLEAIVEEDRDIPDGVEWAKTDGGERSGSDRDPRRDAERTDGGERAGSSRTTSESRSDGGEP